MPPHPRGFMVLILLAAGCQQMPPATAPRAGSSTPTPATTPGVWVTSEPSGLQVVVNGRPTERTPFFLVLPLNSQGFFLEPTSVAVRFLASEGEGQSKTVLREFTRMDKAPLRLLFTPDGGAKAEY